MPLVIYSLMFGSVAILGLASYPPILERIRHFLRQRVDEARVHLDDMFLDLSAKNLRWMHVFAPVVLGLGAWIATGFWAAGLVGAAVGVVLPKILVEQMRRTRRSKFHAQLVDALLLLSSCLRAGLSMVQAFTVVAEELPPPISQEFGLLLKELRMGVSIDEGLAHLRSRMPSDDNTLFSTAVLVARETGGDVTAVFVKLVATLRERKKIKEKIKTLTFMARMQGVIMAMLPIMFAYIVYTMDKNHFTFFLADPTGKMLLAGVVALQALGAVLFMRFSKSPL